MSVLALASIVFADVALGPGPQISGALGCPPFLAAMFTTPRRTAMIGGLCVAVTIVLGGGVVLSSDQVVRISVVAIAAATAVVASDARRLSGRQLTSSTELADIAQLAVLRRIPPRVGPANVAARMVSAAAGARLGGDFYEAVPVGTRVRVLIGDVRGHGLGATQLAGALVGAFRGCDHDQLELSMVIAAMERAFQRMDPSEEDFATVVVAEIRGDGQLFVINCGHPAPLVVTPTGSGGEVRMITPPQARPPLGFGVIPDSISDTLRPGERLLLFTDGITEARAPDGRWFDLPEAAARVSTGDLSDSLAVLEDEVRSFADGRLLDDVTLLAVELPPT